MNATAAAAFLALLVLFADGARASPVSGHPLVGTWRFDYPGGSCQEFYRIRSDGTMVVTSAEQVSESEFEVSPEPDRKGYYRWVDTVRKDNGKSDCSGTVTEVGHSVTNYVRFNESGSVFVVCREEDPATCFGPFLRIGGVES